MFNNDLLEHIGIVNDRHLAENLANQFDNEKLYMAGGVLENTIERAFVKPIGYRHTITGWIILVESRSIDCVGHPWPVRS